MAIVCRALQDRRWLRWLPLVFILAACGGSSVAVAVTRSPAASIAAIAASGSDTAMTLASHAVNSVFMPSRIARSFSMQTISVPLIGAFDSGVALVTAEVKVTVFATGTVTEKKEPPLTLASRRV